MVDFNEKKEPASDRRYVGGALGFGTSFAVGMVLFSLGGHWLDARYGKEPLFTLLGVFLGLVYGGWELWKLVTESNRSTAEGNETESPKGPHESAD